MIETKKQGFGDFVGIDVELASSLPGNICEIGVVWYRDGREVKSYKSLIRPIHEEWGSWQYLNLPYRLHDAMQAPTFPEVWKELEAELRGQILVAHNARTGESIYLGGAIAHHGIEPPQRTPLMCSLSLAKKAWPDQPAHGLRRLALKLGLDFDHHDPESDARVCCQVVLAAAEQHGLESLEEVIRHFDWRPSNLKLVKPSMPPKPAQSPTTSVFGIELTRWESPVNFTGAKKGDRIALSGLAEFEKHQIRSQAKALGFKPTNGINGRTSFVVAGEFMGPAKYARCKAHNVPIITPAMWRKLVP